MNKTTIAKSKDFLADMFGEKQVNIAFIIGCGLAVLYLLGIACKVLADTTANYKALQNAIQA